MKVFVYLMFSALFTCLNLFADQVVLDNGDRLSGTVVRSDGKSLVIKTDYAGEVTVKWSAIAQITADEPLHLSMKEGATAAVPTSTPEGKVVIVSPSGTVTVPKENVAAVRNQAEEEAYEKSLHPGLLMGWDGGLNVGFALTRGNSQTKNLAIAFTADRKTSTDRLSLHANSIYASNDAPSAVPNITANAVRGGFRYDRDINDLLFGFGSADFETDALQNLDLRTVFAGGVGFHAIKSETTTLNFLSGINYTREAYTTFSRNFPAASLNEELTHKWRANTVLTQSAYFYPDLEHTGEYRATFDLGAVTKLNKWLGWQNAFSDIYVTNPPGGKKQNDILFTTGLNISFVH